ncbi:MAG: pantoate--beta-alanine ligase [Planctomycetes bacterium]|nr:pantoate--beta-alanine ligase [Planctomycetota bacterium]
MLQLKSRQQLNDFLPTENVGFVPTMGALHEGHSSLIRRARQENSCVIVSIFVNPLQFNDVDDLAKYPQSMVDDINLLTKLKVDAVYLPRFADIYPEGKDIQMLSGGAASLTFEGEARPGHFDGMLTVVQRLISQVRPQRAYFGEKDAQQLCLVRKLFLENDLKCEIVACAIVRDDKGLALSSRNARLSNSARCHALALSKALAAAQTSYNGGEKHVASILGAMQKHLSHPEIKVVYSAIVDDQSFVELKSVVNAPSRVIIAAVIDGVHLLDNVLLHTN